LVELKRGHLLLVRAMRAEKEKGDWIDVD